MLDYAADISRAERREISSGQSRKAMADAEDFPTAIQPSVSNEGYLSYFGSHSKIRSAKSKASVIMTGPRDRANSPRALHTVNP
jgi:hypothetical protein